MAAAPADTLEAPRRKSAGTETTARGPWIGATTHLHEHLGQLIASRAATRSCRRGASSRVPRERRVAGARPRRGTEAGAHPQRRRRPAAPRSRRAPRGAGPGLLGLERRSGLGASPPRRRRAVGVHAQHGGARPRPPDGRQARVGVPWQSPPRAAGAPGAHLALRRASRRAAGGDERHLHHGDADGRGRRTVGTPAGPPRLADPGRHRGRRAGRRARADAVAGARLRRHSRGLGVARRSAAAGGRRAMRGSRRWRRPRKRSAAPMSSVSARPRPLRWSIDAGFLRARMSPRSATCRRAANWRATCWTRRACSWRPGWPTTPRRPGAPSWPVGRCGPGHRARRGGRRQDHQGGESAGAITVYKSMGHAVEDRRR